MTIIIVNNNCRFYFFIVMELLLESLKLGVAPSLVVAIYLVINKIIDNKKESQSAKINQNIVENFNKLNNFLKYVTDDIIAKESDRRDLAIKNSFDRLENELVKFGTYTIINNNIDLNKDNILDNARHTVISEIHALHSALSLYSPEKINLSIYIDRNWEEEIYNDIVNIIFKDKFTKEQKIYTLHNKINIRINEYKSITLKHHFNATNNN